jgi:hypothetical protein
MEVKTCSGCNESKDISNFHKKSSNTTGYDSKCKECKINTQKSLLEKYCSKCDSTKLTSEFFKNSAQSDGYCSSCKKCSKKYCKTHEDKIIENKICPVCKVDKCISEYNKDSSKLNGYESKCKECKAISTKLYKENKKQTIEYIEVTYKVCSHCNNELDKECFNKNVYSNDCLKSICKKCYSIVRKETNEKSKKHDYETIVIEKQCRKCHLTKPINNFRKTRKSTDNYSYICKDCFPKNEWTKEKQKISEKKYVIKNKAKIRIKWKNQGKKINRRIRDSINHRISEALYTNNVTKNNKTVKYLGCSIEYLKKWFVYLFKDTSMNWYNYGEWEIDHVIPCSSFDFTKDEDIKKCFNWTNLQPLLKEENLEKSNKILPDMINKHKIKVKLFIAKNKEGELLESP